jgi:hypothetical protein
MELRPDRHRVKMKNKEIVFRLLGRALMEIRVCCHENKVNVAFHLGDLFNSIPYRLMKISDAEESYREVLDFIEMRCEQKGISKWLENALRDIADNAESEEEGNQQ